MTKLSLKQMNQIAHALGIDLFKAVMSNKLKDKKLPVEFYRNRYQHENDSIFEELILLGLADKAKWQDLTFYSVNKAGEEKFREQYANLVEYKPLKDRDLSYLRNKINFYCDFYGYRFGSDNFEHVISAYNNYWLKKYKVSHTTEDTILRFKSDLSYYHRKNII